MVIRVLLLQKYKFRNYLFTSNTSDRLAIDSSELLTVKIDMIHNSFI